MNLQRILFSESLQTSRHGHFGVVYQLPDGRLACSPTKYRDEIYYLGGPGNKEVIGKSKDEADVAEFYSAVERRAAAIAKAMFAELHSTDSKSGSVEVRLQNGQRLDLSNEWGNHILQHLT